MAGPSDWLHCLRKISQTTHDLHSGCQISLNLIQTDMLVTRLKFLRRDLVHEERTRVASTSHQFKHD